MIIIIKKKKNSKYLGVIKNHDQNVKTPLFSVFAVFCAKTM